MSSNLRKNKETGRKSRLNKTGSSEFIGFSAFSNNTIENEKKEKTHSSFSAAVSHATQSSSNRGKLGSSSPSMNLRFIPNPVFTLGSSASIESNEKISSSLSTLFKKIARKRDSVTRSKALSELCDIAFIPQKQKKEHITLTKPQIIATLSHLTFLFYSKLAYDNNRTVRAQVLHCLVEAKKSVPKAWNELVQYPCNSDFISYQPSTETKTMESGIETKENISPTVLGIIWCMQADPAPEVQREARKCVEDFTVVNRDSLSSNKNTNEAGIMAYILSMLQHSRPSLLTNSFACTISKNESSHNGYGDKKSSSRKTDDENTKKVTISEDEKQEEDERYERVISSALQGVQLFMKTFLLNFTSTDFSTVPIFQLLLLQNGKIIWKHVTSTRSSHRRESYRLLSTLAQPQSQPKIANDSTYRNEPSISTRILHHTLIPEKHLYPSLSMEKDPSNQPFLLEGILLYLSTLSGKIEQNLNDCSNEISYRWKVVNCPILCKHICKLLKKLCYGSPAIDWAPYLLPLIDLLPMKEDGVTLSCQLISSLCEGRQSTLMRRNDEIAILTAMSECSAHMLLRKVNRSSSEVDVMSLGYQLSDYFNLSLSAYLDLSKSGKPSTSKRRTGSTSGEQGLISCLTRNLNKFENICEEEYSNDSHSLPLIHSVQSYLWGTIHDENHTISEAVYKYGILGQTFTRSDIISESTEALENILQGLVQVKTEKNTFETSNSFSQTSSPLSTSLFIPYMRVVAEQIISKSKIDHLSEKEIKLLRCIFELFGAKKVLPLNIETTSTLASKEVHFTNDSVTSKMIEYFCMNDLLKLTIVRGYEQPNISISPGIIIACFDMLYGCLQVIPSAFHQKRIWETFLNELITAKCSLKALSLGLEVLSIRSTIAIIRCKTLEDLAVQVGTKATKLFSSQIESPCFDQDFERSDNIADKDEGMWTDIVQCKEEITMFLECCVGLAGSNIILVGSSVISSWIKLACLRAFEEEKSKDEDEYTPLKSCYNENYDSNILLNVLLGLTSTTLSTTDLSDFPISTNEIIDLLFEAWHHNKSTWDKVIQILNAKEDLKCSETLSYILNELKSRISLRLQKELLHPTCTDDLLDTKHLERRSLDWSIRAWRLICLIDNARVPKGSYDQLTEVGFNNLELWNLRSRNEIEWSFWCFFHFILHYKEGIHRENIFLGSDIDGAAKFLNQILLSVSRVTSSDLIYILQPKRDPILKRGRLLIDTIFSRNGECVNEFQNFLEICCNVAITSLRDSLSNEAISNDQHLYHSTRVLRFLFSMLLGEGQSVVEIKQTNGINETEIQVGDIYWYENKSNKRIQAKILKVHTDDYPNLYFTIELQGDEGVSERQTVGSRLKKEENECSEYKDTEKSKNKGELRAQRLEKLIFDEIVKQVRISDAFLMLDLKKVETIGYCINLIICHCGLTGSVGLGSLRYEIFQILSFLDGKITKMLSTTDISEYTVKTLGCMSYAMLGNPSLEVSNFETLRFFAINSIEAIYDFYEHKNETQNLTKILPKNFDTSILLWLSISVNSVKDFQSLCRVANIFDQVAHDVLQNKSREYNDLLFNCLITMRGLEGIQDVCTTLSVELSTNSVKFKCAEELIRNFASVWIDSEEESSNIEREYLDTRSKPSWSEPFSSIISSSNTAINNSILVGINNNVNELCETLFSSRKRFYSFHLLCKVAKKGPNDFIHQSTDLSSKCKEVLDMLTTNMTDEEILELHDDYNISCRWLPPNLMAKIEGWLAPEVAQDENKTSVFGQLLTWLVMLEFLESAGNIDSRSRSAISSYVQILGAVNIILQVALKVACLKEKPDEKCIMIQNLGVLNDTDLDSFLAKVGNLVFFRTAQILPTLTKTWWNDFCPRSQQTSVKSFIQIHVAPETFQREYNRLKEAQGLGEMIVNGSCVSREVTATYIQDECQLSVMIHIPKTFPLRNVEVDCRKTKGISEKRWRRWSLQIMRMLNSQDGSVLDALLLWKANVDKEFEGVEPCPVCYSVLCVKTHVMPNLECKTCGNRFHSTCLYKWFHSSGKSQCVLCQQPWSGIKIDNR